MGVNHQKEAELYLRVLHGGRQDDVVFQSFNRDVIDNLPSARKAMLDQPDLAGDPLGTICAIVELLDSLASLEKLTEEQEQSFFNYVCDIVALAIIAEEDGISRQFIIPVMQNTIGPIQ